MNKHSAIIDQSLISHAIYITAGAEMCYWAICYTEIYSSTRQILPTSLSLLEKSPRHWNTIIFSYMREIRAYYTSQYCKETWSFSIYITRLYLATSPRWVERLREYLLFAGPSFSIMCILHHAHAHDVHVVSLAANTCGPTQVLNDDISHGRRRNILHV